MKAVKRVFLSRKKEAEQTDETTFTCTTYLLAVLLFVSEFAQQMFFDRWVEWVATFSAPNWVQYNLPYLLSFAVYAYVLYLLGQQRVVLVEEEYIQIGNSPYHYFAADEIEEIKLKGGFLAIRTRDAWRSGWYHVRKEQREKAHLLLNEWANQHGVLYKIM